MKNSIIKIFFLFALWGGFAACKKDLAVLEEENVTFPLELYITKTTKKTAIKLYTEGREITDTKIINEFINGGYQYGEAFKNDTTYNNPHKTITFLSKDTGLIHRYVGGYIIGNLDDSFPDPNIRNFSVRIANNQFTYTVITSFKPEFKLTFNSVGTYEEQILPFYCVQDNFSEVLKGTYLRLGNFDQNIISTLKNNDTIAVQEFYHTLKTK